MLLEKKIIETTRGTEVQNGRTDEKEFYMKLWNVQITIHNRVDKALEVAA